MKDGFIRCAACSIDITVADPYANSQKIIEAVNRADEQGIKLLCLPELCLTGCSCGDLFHNSSLIAAAERALFDIMEQTSMCDVIFVLGLPIRHFSKLYNCAAVIFAGEILGIVPKTGIVGAQKRFFESADRIGEYEFHRFTNGTECSIGSGLLFSHETAENYIFGVEIGSDAFSQTPPSENLCKKGAKIILNPSSDIAMVGSVEHARMMITSLGARYLCGYVRANASYGESTVDAVFASTNIICERSLVLAESGLFDRDGYIVSEIDVDMLSGQRARCGYTELGGASFTVFSQRADDRELVRHIAENPFIPESREELDRRCELIFSVQAQGLVKRIEHTNAKKLVLGISGGLDSTLALLVCIKALDICGRDHSDLITVTMPCFGTTQRTKTNAQKLCESFQTTFVEVDITASVRQHFADIGHDESVRDVTYENAQARERTQVIMDIANKYGGMVIGTGDLSELALGWCTYNGDQMSMYGVNAGVPKTLIRHIVSHEAELAEAKCMMMLSETLFDILDTPVSPELLPPDESGDILQKTEDIVGPYELHDFFIYYTVRFGFSSEKIYRLACKAYRGVYSGETVRAWLDVFVRRFFSQQFKRSCMPDGARVGSVSLSPRGGLCMPSDASCNVFMM